MPLPRGHRAHNQLNAAFRKYRDLGALAARCQTGWCWRSPRPSSACGRLCQWLVVRSAETATQPPRRSPCLINNDSARGGSWLLASAGLFQPERMLAGGFLRQRGAHLQKSSELSDWNSNLQATIAQPPRAPGGSGPRPQRGGLRSTLERKSRATNDQRKRSRGHLSRDRTLRRQKRQRPSEAKPADHNPRFGVAPKNGLAVRVKASAR